MRAVSLFIVLSARIRFGGLRIRTLILKNVSIVETEWENMILTLLGNRGTGKSTLSEYLAKRLSNHVIVWDSANQFDNADYTFTDLDEFQDFLEEDEGVEIGRAHV